YFSRAIIAVAGFRKPRYFLLAISTNLVHFPSKKLSSTKMYAPVSTKDPAAVEAELQSAYLAMFPNGDRFFVPRIFGWATECFTGNYGDYQPVDAHYHDFDHT